MKTKELIKDIFEPIESKPVQTYFELVIDTIENGEIDDAEHSLNDQYVTVTISHQTNSDITTDVKLEIDWKESEHGFKFELTPVELSYWNGSEMKCVDLTEEIHNDISVTLKNRITAYVEEHGTLEDTRIDMEESRAFGWDE